VFNYFDQKFKTNFYFLTIISLYLIYVLSTSNKKYNKNNYITGPDSIPKIKFHF